MSIFNFYTFSGNVLIIVEYPWFSYGLSTGTVTKSALARFAPTFAIRILSISHPLERILSIFKLRRNGLCTITGEFVGIGGETLGRHDNPAIALSRNNDDVCSHEKRVLSTLLWFAAGTLTNIDYFSTGHRPPSPPYETKWNFNRCLTRYIFPLVN